MTAESGQPAQEAIERRQLAVTRERTAFHIIVGLSEGVHALPVLEGLCSKLEPRHYACVVEERSLGNCCGLPLCDKPRGHWGTAAYSISRKDKLVYDVRELRDFCSPRCHALSQALQRRLMTAPLWSRGDFPAISLESIFEEVDSLQEYPSVIVSKSIHEASQNDGQEGPSAESGDSSDPKEVPETEQPTAASLSVADLIESNVESIKKLLLRGEATLSRDTLVQELVSAGHLEEADSSFREVGELENVPYKKPSGRRIAHQAKYSTEGRKIQIIERADRAADPLDLAQLATLTLALPETEFALLLTRLQSHWTNASSDLARPLWSQPAEIDSDDDAPPAAHPASRQPSAAVPAQVSQHYSQRVTAFFASVDPQLAPTEYLDSEEVASVMVTVLKSDCEEDAQPIVLPPTSAGRSRRLAVLDTVARILPHLPEPCTRLLHTFVFRQYDPYLGSAEFWHRVAPVLAAVMQQAPCDQMSANNRFRDFISRVLS